MKMQLIQLGYARVAYIHATLSLCVYSALSNTKLHAKVTTQ